MSLTTAASDRRVKDNVKDNIITRLTSDLELIHRDLIPTYINLTNKVYNLQLERCSEKYKDRGARMTGLGAITALLALIQIGLLQLVNATSGNDLNSQTIIVAITNLFAYLALVIDTLGSIFALTTAWSFIRLSSQATALITQKRELDQLIIGTHTLSSETDKTKLSSLRETAVDAYTSVSRYQHIITHHKGGEFGVMFFILMGLVSFFVAVLVHVISSQPRYVWIPLVIVVSAMIFILIKSGHHSRPRTWRHAMQQLRNTFLGDLVSVDPHVDPASFAVGAKATSVSIPLQSAQSVSPVYSFPEINVHPPSEDIVLSV